MFIKESHTVYTAFEKSYSLLLVLNYPLHFKEEGSVGGERDFGVIKLDSAIYLLSNLGQIT